MISLEKLKNSDEYNSKAGKIKRGYDFEKYIFDCFEGAGLEVQRPYKTWSEQIDGGIYIDGQWYLIEIKWHTQKLPVSEVYTFKGKVDGKLTGTKGLFISWSGYSNECADALALGKDLNIVLFDQDDVEKSESVGWKEVIKEKLRFAALYGEVYVSSKLISATKIRTERLKTIELFVEGQFEANIYIRILNKLGVKEELVVFPCSGKLSAIKMASTLSKRQQVKRILIVDTDGNPNQDNELSHLINVDLVVCVEPMIEALLDPERFKSTRDRHTVIYDGAQQLFSPLDAHIDGLIDKLIINDEQGVIRKLRDFIKV